MLIVYVFAMSVVIRRKIPQLKLEIKHIFAFGILASTHCRISKGRDGCTLVYCLYLGQSVELSSLLTVIRIYPTLLANDGRLWRENILQFINFIMDIYYKYFSQARCSRCFFPTLIFDIPNMCILRPALGSFVSGWSMWKVTSKASLFVMYF